MLITCDNKGCLKQTDAQLNVEALEVMCLECKRSIKNISETMIRVLKSSGQIIRDMDKKAFMMACRDCNANRAVVLNDSNQAVCSICKSSINVHPAMKQAMMATGTRLT